MNTLYRISTMMVATILSGCTPILKEVRYPGGYPGHILDKRTFNASYSKEVALLRATLVVAMAADMGRFTVSGQDADSFSKLISAAVQEINFAAADIYQADGSNNVPCPVTYDSKIALPFDDAGCAGFYTNFESNLPKVENRVVKVMIAALPTDKVRKFLDDVVKGNVLGAAIKGASAAASAAGGFHIAAARYRSGLEVVAGHVAGKGKCKPTTTFNEIGDTVLQAAACLGLSKEDLFSNPNEVDAKDMALAIQPRAFHMLMRSIAADCVALDFAGSGEDLVASQKLRAATCNGIGFMPTPRPYRLDAANDYRRIAQAEIGTVRTDADLVRLDPLPASPLPTPSLFLTESWNRLMSPLGADPK